MLQEISRTQDGDSLIASQCLEVLVAGDEVVCLSRECRCYHEVIFQMTRHALDCNRERNKARCTP